MRVVPVHAHTLFGNLHINGIFLTKAQCLVGCPIIGTYRRRGQAYSGLRDWMPNRGLQKWQVDDLLAHLEVPEN